MLVKIEREGNIMSSLIQRYNFWGLLGLAYNVIVTKLFFAKAKLLRSPFYIRGGAFIEIGKNFVAGVGLRIDAFPDKAKVCIKIGDNVQVNDYVHIGAVDSLTIGNNVLIASRVFISDHDHGLYGNFPEQSSPDVPPVKRKLNSSAVYVEDNVWIGEGVGILSGVRIGKGSIIGCGAIVTRNIPESCLAVGNPARVIKKYRFTTKKWENV